MREILFRAKAINRNKGYHRTKYKNGDWVYGLITKLYDEQFKNLPAEMTNEYGIRGIEIDHETIGQYTGLTDKNGEKIFEGDILEFSDRLVFVYWHTHLGCWDSNFLKFTNKENSRDDMSPLNWSHKGKVIGNIHDNLESMKGGE